MNSRFAKIHEKAQEQKCLKNWTVLKIWNEKKYKFKSLLNPVQWPPDNFPGSLDHLVIALVDNAYKKLEKTSKNLLAYINPPLC